jgi:hypothetical protein
MQDKKQDLRYSRIEKTDNYLSRVKADIEEHRQIRQNSFSGQVVIFCFSLLIIAISLFYIFKGNTNGLLKISTSSWRFNISLIIAFPLSLILCYYSFKNMVRGRNKKGKEK